MDSSIAATQIMPTGIGLTARFSPRARALMVLAAAGLVAVVSAAWLWSSSPSYSVLFTNLSDRDGGAVIAQLSQMNVPYRNADGGTILVPADKVHEARLKLASQGLPKGSVVGFEILESQKFGLTQFQEQLNYQRALEGELARSIQSLAPVASARVHLALPKNSGFLRDRQAPTASVLVQLHPGKTLERGQVAGIVHLVASSIPELTPKNVSVVDQHGTLLATQSEGQGSLDGEQLDYVSQIETATIKRIEDILEPIVGRTNVRAQVTADVDFSNVEQMDESYRPNQGSEKAAIRSQQSTENSQSAGAGAQGVPGALSNQPPVPATAPINGQPAAATAPPAAPGASAHREQVTNFEVDKNVRHTKTASGEIRRLTAAVVINNKPAAAPAPSPTTSGATGAAAPVAAPAATPWSQKEMDNIQALVREAMGFNEKRGDSLNVVNVPFSQLEVPPLEPTPWLQQPEAIALGKEIGKAVLFLMLTLIVVFGVVRPALKAISSQTVIAPEAPAPAVEAPAPPRPAISSSQLDAMRQIARADPATVANVVKSWVGEPKN
ncbi:MAG TPA: flagellar basal-body MS-ring/collar protein FliF [Burkholderiaceae bacterium]|nr:flagellar basal-body MS-ring/collar protein FliF [Burkholderiaceae bacterium]